MIATPDGGHIHFEQETQADLFAIIPERVARDDRISGNALRIYCALLIEGKRAQYRGGPGYPGQDALGELYGMSGRNVRRGLNELIEAQYISTERVGLGRPDNITIHRLP